MALKHPSLPFPIREDLSPDSASFLYSSLFTHSLTTHFFSAEAVEIDKKSRFQLRAALIARFITRAQLKTHKLNSASAATMRMMIDGFLLVMKMKSRFIFDILFFFFWFQ